MIERSDIIPLAFHVDYWNYIGWTDPFASKRMTHRQKAYSRTLGQRYVYTPEMVVNGAAHEVGSNRQAIERLIEAAKNAPAAGPSISLSREDDGRIRLRVGAADVALSPAASVWIATFDRPHTTSIPIRENKGPTLTDYQVVRTFEQIATWSGEALDMVFALDERNEPGDGGCAVLVQRDGAGPILSAA